MQAYQRGQLKVSTQDIQSARHNVASALFRIVENRVGKGKTTADPVVSDVMALLEHKMQALTQVGGGVCHGLVYAWFASLKDGQTNLNFDVEEGGWSGARPRIAQTAVQNQATNSARFLSRVSTMGDAAAKSRASGKMAKDAGFAEAEVCYATVSRPAVEAVLARVITDDSPSATASRSRPARASTPSGSCAADRSISCSTPTWASSSTIAGTTSSRI